MRHYTVLTIGVFGFFVNLIAVSAAEPASRPAVGPTTRPVGFLDADMAERLQSVRALVPADEWAEKVEAKRRGIQQQLEDTTNADERILLSIAFANWDLAETCAPGVMRWIMGYRHREDLEQLGRVSASALERLDEAEKQLEELGESSERSVQKQRTRWGENIKVLRLFAEAGEALSRAVPKDAGQLKDSQGACRDAALNLAELREAEDADTAAAAKLWQGLLFEAGGRPERALSTLDLALAAPNQLPYDFFQRLLRCEMLQARGSFALADGLVLRMGEQIKPWFGSSGTDADEARATLAAQRVIGLCFWADDLKQVDPAVAEQLSARADELIKKHFKPAKAEIYRMGRTIPIFVEIPAPAEKSPTSQSATAPTATKPTREGESQTKPATQDADTKG